jgi:nucleotide-binding universal stress UspA family protein
MRPRSRRYLEQAQRTAMLKNLLVQIPSERPIRPVVDSAISLAVSSSAHLDAVSIGFESANVGLAVDGAAAVVAVFDVERERALARATAALAVFETEARNAGIPYSCQALTAVPVDAFATLGAMARLYDLSIVLQPDPDHTTSDNMVPTEMLFQAGGPVLFIPYTHKGALKPRHVGIAWDGSRLAARSVRDAAPFLAHAKSITIISVNETQNPAETSAATLVTHLARRGLAARIESIGADHSDVQPSILSVAADAGIDLIVMGGYGHSRLQERILGGVTRGMLQSMTVPTLMSH